MIQALGLAPGAHGGRLVGRLATLIHLDADHRRPRHAPATASSPDPLIARVPRLPTRCRVSSYVRSGPLLEQLLQEPLVPPRPPPRPLSPVRAPSNLIHISHSPTR